MKTTKLMLPFILLFAGICIQLNAATLTVTNTSDSGVGSLRAQIVAAAAGDIIAFDSSTNGIPIVLTSGEIAIFQRLTINGNGISNTIIDGNDTSRIFLIFTGAANVTIHGLTIQNGATSGFPGGGGILNFSLFIVNIDHCAFLSCSVLGDGGGIYTEEGTMNITSCTFDGNHADHWGGGIRITSANVNIEACTFTNNTSGSDGGGINNGGAVFTFPGILIVKNTTISGNSAASDGGGARGPMAIINCTIANNHANGNGGGGKSLDEGSYGFASMSNCIVYNNTAGVGGPDLAGPIVSGGYNIIGDASGSSGFVATDLFVNPLLGALADNGGPTKTIALLCSSPAIDAADTATTGTDQRGVAMFGGRKDIGAFESELVCPSLTASLTGPGTACAFSSETYTTQAGMTNYAWTLSGTAGVDYHIFTGGPGNSFVELEWRTDGNHTVTVSYTNPAYPCCTVTSDSVTTQVAGATVPFISGPINPCVNAVATYTINPVAGTTYLWSTPPSSPYTVISGGGSNDSITVQWLASGSKHIDLHYLIHLGQGNCQGQTSKSVTVHPNPICQITGDEVICSGGSTTLNAGSHSNYLWSTTETTQTISVNTPGTYTATVSNAFGCMASSSVTVTQAQPLIATCSGTNVTCNGGANGTAAVTVTGGIPEAVSQYLWSNGATTSGIGNLTPGTYTVTVTRGSGCITTCSYTVTAPAALTVDAGPNKFVFRGYPDSSCTTLQSTISGGTLPYTRQWSTAGNSNLGSGSSLNVCNLTTPKIYYLTVTDANGCSKTDSARVCVFDVRCGSGNKKVTICHGTGSVTNPFVTLCITPLDARNHFLSHPGEKLGTCGMNRTCSFPIMPNRLDEMTEEEYDMSLTAYPNPASETINISYYTEEGGIYSLRVINITGQTLLSETKQAEEGENNFTLNLKGFAAGMYTVLLQSGDDLVQTRIMKQ